VTTVMTFNHIGCTFAISKGRKLTLF